MPDYMDVMRWATLAVDFFFCLSGFVIAHAYQAKLESGMSFWVFLQKRLVRLYPMYLLGTLVGLAAVVRLTQVGATNLGLDGTLVAFGLHLAYLPYFVEHELVLFGQSIENMAFPLNSPAWSLFFELVCATLLYGATARWRRFAPLMVAVGAVGVYLAIRKHGAGAGWGHENFLAGFPRVLFAHFTGVVIHRMPAIASKVRPWTMSAVGLGIVALFTMPPFLSSRWLFLTAVFVLMPAVVVVAASCALPLGGFGHRLCDYLGRLSYPIYSIHYPVMMLIAGWWFSQPRLEHFALFVAASIMLSHLLMVTIDEPLRRRLRMHLAI